MTDQLVDAGCVALVYALVRYAEAKFILKTKANGRSIMKDTVMVCVSALAALWAANRLGVGQASAAPTQAFVGKPEF